MLGNNKENSEMRTGMSKISACGELLRKNLLFRFVYKKRRPKGGENFWGQNLRYGQKQKNNTVGYTDGTHFL